MINQSWRASSSDRLEDEDPDALGDAALEPLIGPPRFDPERGCEPDPSVPIEQTGRLLVGGQQIGQHLLGQAGTEVGEQAVDGRGVLGPAGQLEPGEVGAARHAVETDLLGELPGCKRLTRCRKSGLSPDIRA